MRRVPKDGRKGSKVGKSKPKKVTNPIADAVDRARLTQEYERQRAALRDVAGELSLRRTLERMVSGVTPVFDAPPKYRPAKVADAATSETLLLLLSDWHAYEIVRSERVLGLNAYDSEVCGRRVHQVTQSAISIKRRLERGGYRFPNLVVAANGDMISGTIHEVEKHSDAPSVIQAAYGCGLLLAQSLRDLAGEFERVTVYGTAGNHGRLPDQRRVSQKDPNRSWDTLIYLFAKTALQDVKNVEIIIPDSYTVVYELEGWRFYQGHGHDIKSWQSIPFYGISRAATGLNALRTAAGSPIHYFLFSHFHNPGSITAPGSEYFVNGSLIGGTEFSVNGLGRADRPCQWMLGIHRDHGVTHRWALYADSGKHEGTYAVQPWKVPVD